MLVSWVKPLYQASTVVDRCSTSFGLYAQEGVPGGLEVVVGAVGVGDHSLWGGAAINP